MTTVERFDSVYDVTISWEAGEVTTRVLSRAGALALFRDLITRPGVHAVNAQPHTKGT